MFIVSTKNGKYYHEGKVIGSEKPLTWDDIPKDTQISGIQLTYPFKVELKDQGKTIAPTLTIGRYDRYFFYNEAKIAMMVIGDKPVQAGHTILVAKIVGGIDKKAKMVFEVRLDRMGNCTNTRYPLKDLEARIEAGTFRKEIIRDGA